MAFLDRFNLISAIEYKRCSELVIDTKYPIISLENAHTKYGTSVLATLRDPVDSSLQYRVYLPKRYASVFTDEELRHINPEDFHLIYRGMKDRTTIVDVTP